MPSGGGDDKTFQGSQPRAAEHRWIKNSAIYAGLEVTLGKISDRLREMPCDDVQRWHAQLRFLHVAPPT